MTPNAYPTPGSPYDDGRPYPDPIVEAPPTLAELVDDVERFGDLGEHPPLYDRDELLAETTHVSPRALVRRRHGQFDTLTVLTLPDGRLQLTTNLPPHLVEAALRRLAAGIQP